MPAISVIVPVYKVEKYIHRCVDSILAQTFTDFELILVDDGSPDNCGVICDEYAEKDSRIVVIHQKNGGLSAARNAGIDWTFANSDSQWLTFIDSDDWIHPRYLAALHSAVQKHGVAVSICSYKETSGKELYVHESELREEVHPVEDFYVERNVNATVAWGKLYAKDCFKNIRYPVGKIHEDEFVTYRILFEFEKIAFVPAPLYAYYQNPEGITKSTWNMKRLDAEGAIKDYIQFFQKKGYARAYKKSIENYVWFLCYTIDELQADVCVMEQKELLSEKRHKLAKLLCMNRDMYPFSQEYYWRYDKAFPRLMSVFWFFYGQWNKLTGKRK